MEAIEKRKARAHRYYESHKDAIRKYHNKWVRKNKKHVHDYQAAYRAANPDKCEQYLIRTYIRYLTSRGYTVTAPEGGEA